MTAKKQPPAKFAGWTVQRRMAEAVRLVVEENWTQGAAADHCGVSRPRVNVNVKARRAQLAESERRSQAAREERIAAFDAQQAATHSQLEFQDGALPEPQVSVEVAPGADLTGTDMEYQPGLYKPELVIRSTDQVLRISNESRRVPPPGEFIRKYFGNVICPDCNVHHEVPGFHDHMLTKLNDPAVRRLLINIAPYHAKTTIGTVYDSIYKSVKDPNIRIGIVSKAEMLARRILGQIAKLLTDPSLYPEGSNLIEDWGPFYMPTNVWSATELFIAGRQSAEKDPTFSAYGVGAQIYGVRFDEIKFDDIADLKNQKNPDLIAEQLAWIVQEAASRVGKTGKLSAMGTRIAPNDVYSYLKQLPAWEVVSYPCIVDEFGQRTLWEEHFPYAAAVEQRESMKLEAFQLVYQNVDTPGFGAAFPLDVLERTQDQERRLGQYSSTWRIVLGVDPAGAGDQAGFTAMVVLGVDTVTGERYIIDLVNVRQMRAPQIKDQIIAFADQYPLSEIRVEVNGLQSQLFQYDFELINKLTNRGVRFVPHITTGKNKWDQQFGVEAMGPMFYNGTISCPWGDINSRRKVQELHDQLAQFPMGQVSDLVMALWFAELGCKELFQRFRLPAFDNRPHIPNRIKRRRRVIDFSNGEVRPPTEEELGNPFKPTEKRQLVNVAQGVSLYVGGVDDGD